MCWSDTQSLNTVALWHFQIQAGTVCVWKTCFWSHFVTVLFVVITSTKTTHFTFTKGKEKCLICSFMGSDNILRHIVTHTHTHTHATSWKNFGVPFSDQFTIYGMWYGSLNMPTGFMDHIECYMTDKWHTVTQQINDLLNFPCLIFFLSC